MPQEKKKIREQFRTAVFERDGHRCRICRKKPLEGEQPLDAHHIVDRNELPNGGYVKENGIALCGEDHQKAEVFHSTGTPLPGYSPDELYRLIGSSKEKALTASKRLGPVKR